MSRAFIKDGYTAKGFVKERPHLHEDVRFEYRRILHEERAAFIDRIQKANDSPHRSRITAAVLAAQLLKWDLCDDEGQPVPVKAESVVRCEPSLIDRLADIILYRIEGGDTDPKWSAAEKKEHDETGEVSALTGKPFGDVLDEADAKN